MRGIYSSSACQDAGHPLSIRSREVVLQRLLRCTAQKQNAQPVPHPLDSSFRWNDENDTPVIPGEQRETRNPGAPCFCLHAERAALWGTRNDTFFLAQQSGSYFVSGP